MMEIGLLDLHEGVSGAVRCPRCHLGHPEDTMAHINTVSVYENDDDYGETKPIPTVITMDTPWGGIDPTPATPRTQWRGGQVHLRMSCESGHAWTLAFSFHKGQVWCEVLNVVTLDPDPAHDEKAE